MAHASQNPDEENEGIELPLVSSVDHTDVDDDDADERTSAHAEAALAEVKRFYHRGLACFVAGTSLFLGTLCWDVWRYAATTTAPKIDGSVSSGGNRSEDDVLRPPPLDDFRRPPSKKPLCARDELRDGRWSAITLDRAPYEPVDPWEKSCASREGRNFSTAWKTWRWEPRSERCAFAEWNASRFCDLLLSSFAARGGGGDDGEESTTTTVVSFAGDSTTWQHFASLTLLLGLTVVEHEQHISWRSDLVKRPCDGKVKMTYRRTDDLGTLRGVLEAQRPDVAVINTGAHYRPDEALNRTLRSVVTELEAWQSARPSRLAILRTSMPGHPSCTNFTEPSDSLEEMEALIADRDRYGQFKDGNNFHWWDLKHQNDLMEHAFSESNLAFDIIDAYDMEVLRPDMHQSAEDCLHYCLPGPLDTLSRAFLHVLSRRVGDAGR